MKYAVCLFVAMGAMHVLLDTNDAHAVPGSPIKIGPIKPPSPPNLPSWPKPPPRPNLPPGPKPPQFHPPAESTFPVEPGPAFRTGELTINNNYSGTITVVLYHPANFSRQFASWTIAPGNRDRLIHNGNKMIIGSDWQMEFVFGNGVRSPRGEVGQYDTYGNGQFLINAGAVYNASRKR